MSRTRKAAEDALRLLFADTSVSREETLDAIETLRAECDELIEMLHEDIDAEATNPNEED